MKKIINIITKNWLAKIACLILALILFVYVGIGSTKSAEFPGGIPLIMKNAPQGLVPVCDTTKVTVKVIAEKDVFNKLSNESFSAYVDLAGYTEGTHDVKVVVLVNTTGVTIAEINPATVVVRLEPGIDKEVPVVVSIDGKAGEGLVAGEAKTDPSVVRVSGARSIINSLTQATAKLTLAGETTDFKKMVTLEAFDARGEKYQNLVFSPAEVIVNVPIVKASNVKTVGIKVKTVGQPAEGYWITKIETDPKLVTVTASEAMIAKVAYIETSDVNLDNLDKNTTIYTTLAPAGDVSVIDNPEKVKIDIYIGKSQSTKEMESGLEWQGLQGNLKVTSADPVMVKVVVAGNSNVLADLMSSDIAILVDLSGLNNPGTYAVDISRSNISGPPGVSISSVVPSSINIRLDTK